jgi:transposase-like protein
MARKARMNRSPEFKAKVALAAVVGQQTASQLATLYSVHPIQITRKRPVNHVRWVPEAALRSGRRTSRRPDLPPPNVHGRRIPMRRQRRP